MLAKKTMVILVLGVLLSGCFSENTEESKAQHLQRAKAYQEQGQYKAAIIEYRNAIKKSQGAAESLVQYADMLNTLGRNASALDALDQVKEEGKDERYQIELVETYIGLNKYQSAQQALDKIQGQTAETALLKAQVAAGKGDLEASEQMFGAIISQADNDPEIKSRAFLGLAMTLARQSRFQPALQELGNIPVQDPSYPKAQVVKAGMEIAAGDLEAAETTLSDVLSRMRNTDIIEPDRAVVLERLAYVLTRLGRTSEAYIYQKLLAEAFPGANKVTELYKTALEAFQQKDYAQAKAALQSILKDYPSHDKAKQLLGVISYLEGDTRQASEYLSDSVDPEVADPLTRHIYAATSLKLQDPKKVLDILGSEIEQTDSAKTLSLYGLAAISDGQGSKGEQALLKAAGLEPENVRIKLTLANYYLNQAPVRPEKALKQLEMAYAIAPTDQQVLTDLVAYHFRQSGLEKAKSFIREAHGKHPEAYGTNLVAGYVSVASKSLEQALPYFSKAVTSGGAGQSTNEALFAKGRTEFGLGKLDDAETSLLALITDAPEYEQGYAALYALYTKQQNEVYAADKLLALAKRNAQLTPYLVLIKASLANGDIEKSKEYFQNAKEISQDREALANVDRSIRYTEAMQALSVGQLAEARQIIVDLLSETPEHLRLLSSLVDIEIRDGKVDEAERLVAEIEAIDANHPVIPVLSGDIDVVRNKLEDARGHYEQAWSQGASNLVADKLLAVLSMLKDEPARQSFLKSWQEKIPSAAKPVLIQAITMQERGQKLRATEAYQKVLTLQPENIAALNNLGWLYFEQGDFNESLELLNKAATLAPGNPAVLDSLGWVLFKNNQRDQALPYLEKASQLAPENEEIRAHLETARKAG